MSKFSINSSVLMKILFVIFVPFLLAGYSWSSSTDATVGAVFYDDNDSIIANIQGEIGSSIYVPTPPAKSGHTFTHWQEVDGDETIASGVVYYTLTRTIEFKAQYTPNMHTVTFLDYDDDIVAQINATQGSSIEVPDAPDRTGYTFTHWKEMGGSETIADGVTSYTVTKSIVFKAQYTPDAAIIYNVKFLDYDDEVIADINATDGSSINVPTTPPRTGYTFTQWQEVAGSETIASGVITYTVTKDIVFKAQYSSANIYTVTFVDYEDEIVAQINATAGSSIQVPNAPDRTGYTFTHWKEMGGSETISNSTATYTVTKNIIFKAQYIQDAPIVYNVKFLDYDDELIQEINATAGSSIQVPTPDREGYTFTQWKEVAGSETIASGVTTYTVTKDIIFKAQYTVVSEYTIIFLDDNDTVVAEINASAGSSIQVPNAPPIPNYTFTSWIEVGGTERISSGETHYTVTRDVTFKAQYVAITYTAIFLNENNGVEANLSGAYGSSITVPNAPPKTGYTFTQWKEEGGTVTIPSGTNTYTLVRDITFKPEYVDSFDGTHIYTQADLNKVRNNLSGKYILMNDIALADNGAGYDSSGWQPIGNSYSNPFKGTFDGNGHKITGLWIDRGGTNYVGLFGATGGATIKNLGVEIGSRGVKGENNVGGIVGQMYDISSITNSYSTGSVSGSNEIVGGIVGRINSGSITNSYSTGSVSGGSFVGGIVGYIQTGSSITNSYSTGSVSGSINQVGGIVGYIWWGDIVTGNAAINPSVSGASDVNRIVGYIDGGNTTSNNFALNTMTVTGKTNGNAGTSKTITNLKTQSTYSNPVNGDGNGGLGWKFGNDENNPWKIDPYKNNGLPYLYWENR